ncbi:MAG: trypsin-like peptidase domain-containing protein [Bacteroidota bacterium]
MNSQNRYLSAILLVLIGVIVGTIMAFYHFENRVDDRADVEITEVKHSAQPLFTDEQLEKLDDRFLFKQVAERVTPMVAYIETTVPFSKRDMPNDEYHDDDGFWGEMLPKKARTVGSGIIISSDGYILTNNHVVDGAVNDEIEVVLNDKRTFDGRIVGQDPTTDLAVLKIDALNLPSITIGNSDELGVGEWVLAVGNPFRLRSTVTAGIVSALSRDVQIINDQMRVESFIQTDAAINKGNSGGALVNTSGELVGVNTAIASQSGSYQGYGFAVPSNLASKVAEDIIEYGHVRRALLGVSIASVDAGIADYLGMDRIEGVQITGISPDGAAEKHNLKRDDVILTVNGQTVNESNQLQQKIAVLNPGDTVELTIWRDGKTIQKEIVLGVHEQEKQDLSYEDEPEIKELENESPNNSESGRSFNEVEFAEFDLGFRLMAILRSEEPIKHEFVISDIVEGSRADKMGLRVGQKIIGVNGQKVEDLESLKHFIAQKIDPSSPLAFEIETREGTVKTLKSE